MASGFILVCGNIGCPQATVHVSDQNGLARAGNLEGAKHAQFGPLSAAGTTSSSCASSRNGILRLSRSCSLSAPTTHLPAGRSLSIGAPGLFNHLSSSPSHPNTTVSLSFSATFDECGVAFWPTASCKWSSSSCDCEDVFWAIVDLEISDSVNL